MRSESKRKIKGLCALVLSMLLLTLLVPAGSANSGNVDWYGTDSAGVRAAEGRCPLQVQSERLIFDLPVFPKINPKTENNAHYGGSVTADYIFYNPTEKTVTATLAFPVGPLPSYYYNANDGSGGRVFPPESFGVTVNGKTVPCETRYTFLGADDAFDAETQLRMFSSALASTALLTPETVLTIFTFRAEGLPGTDDAYCSLRPDAQTLPDGAQIALADEAWSSTDGEGLYLHNGERFYLLCFGDVPSEPDLSLLNAETGERLPAGRMTPQTKETVTLEAFFDRQTAFLTGRERTDRYNAAIYALDRWLREADGEVFDFTFSLTGELTPWCVYSLTVAPGKTAENTVQAPIYPQVDVNLLPASYNYTYYWSPAATWADFGPLDVEIHTPFLLRGCTPDEAVKTDDGYALHFDSLPAGELRFSLGRTGFLKINKNIVLTCALLAVVFGLPVFGIFFVIIRKIKKKKTKQEW